MRVDKEVSAAMNGEVGLEIRVVVLRVDVGEVGQIDEVESLLVERKEDEEWEEIGGCKATVIGREIALGSELPRSRSDGNKLRRKKRLSSDTAKLESNRDNVHNIEASYG